MTDSADRERRDLRDPREPDERRDVRDPRESDDPRDARDPRLAGDPRLGDERSGIPLFVKALVAGIVVGLVAVVLVAWQLAALRINEEQRDCRRAVASREDGRAVWLYLVARDPERVDDPDVVAFVEFLNDRLPPLTCEGSTPTPITPSTTQEES